MNCNEISRNDLFLVESHSDESKNKTEGKTSGIDWEQRRYELAKAATNGILSSGWLDKKDYPYSEEYARQYYIELTRWSLGISDVMIKQLKEEKK